MQLLIYTFKVIEGTETANNRVQEAKRLASEGIEIARASLEAANQTWILVYILILITLFNYINNYAALESIKFLSF